MPDSIEHQPNAGRSETAGVSSPDALAPVDSELVGIFHRQSMALLKGHEQMLRYNVDRTQAWIDFGAVWINGCIQLSRDTIDTAHNSVRTAIDDSANLYRLWAEIGFHATAPVADSNAQANR